MEKYFKAFNFTLIIITLVGYLSHYISPADFWLPNIIGIGFPVLLLLNVLFIFYWILKKSHLAIYSILTLVVGWSIIKATIGLECKSYKSKDCITIMNYNINGLSLLQFKDRTEGIESFNKFLNKENPDIICFQEFTNSRKGLEYHVGTIKYLANMNYLTRSDDNSTVVISKFPITNTGNVPFENGNGSNGCSYMDIKIKNKTLRLYNLHLESNRVSGRAKDIASDRKINKQKLFDLKSILGSIKKFSSIRSKQTDQVANKVFKEKLPTIVCGDFNEPPLSYTYSKFTKKFKDAFSNCGCGFGTTYAGNIPGLKIDHVFYNEQVQMLSTNILKVPYSDHNPTVSKFKL